MQSVVTKRFIECHNYLLDNTELRSSRQFALRLGYQPQSLNEILNGRRDVPLKVVHSAVEVFDVNPVFLFTGEGDELGSAIIESTIDQQETNGKISYVSVSAQAGYGGQLDTPYFGEDIETFTLPGNEFKMGEFRCFDIDGDSMEPSLEDGDMVVCNHIELNRDFSCIRNNQVYVVVTQNDIVVKRVLNNIQKPDIIELHSDNNFFKPYTLRKSEVKEIWGVKMRLSRFNCRANQNKPTSQELEGLQTLVKNQTVMIGDLNKTIDKLLKITRTRN